MVIGNYVCIHIDNSKWLVRAEYVIGLTKCWRLGLLLAFSLSQGVFSHVLVRESKDQYFSEAKEVAMVQGKDAAGYSLSWRGFPRRGRDTLRFGLGVVPSSLSLSVCGENKTLAAVTVGRTRRHCEAPSPTAFSYRDVSETLLVRADVALEPY